MELFNVNAKIEKLHSEKKGTDYLQISIPLSSDYTLKYFPKDAEKAIINRSDYLDNKNLNSSDSSDSVNFEDFA